MGSRSQANLKGSTRLGSYLRRLRTGYGYSLRRVEERARAEGGHGIGDATRFLVAQSRPAGEYLEIQLAEEQLAGDAGQSD